MVAQYIGIYDTNSITDRAQLPVPEPSDINQAGLINFDDLEQELVRIKASVEGIKFLFSLCAFFSCRKLESFILVNNIAGFHKKRELESRIGF